MLRPALLDHHLSYRRLPQKQSQCHLIPATCAAILLLCSYFDRPPATHYKGKYSSDFFPLNYESSGSPSTSLSSSTAICRGSYCLNGLSSNPRPLALFSKKRGAIGLKLNRGGGRSRTNCLLIVARNWQPLPAILLQDVLQVCPRVGVEDAEVVVALGLHGVLQWRRPGRHTGRRSVCSTSLPRLAILTTASTAAHVRKSP